jgi:hypothetical protein
MKLIAQHYWGNPLISINKFQMPDPSAAKKDDNPAAPQARPLRAAPEWAG